MSKKIKDALVGFFGITFVLSGVVIMCYLLLGEILEISGDSMVPTLHDKERILVEKLSPKFVEYKRGEIVVFESTEGVKHLVIKRIVGMPGDIIKISGGVVYINEEPANETYLTSGIKTNAGEKIQENAQYQILENSYVVLGDNRNHSIDSRSWGAIDKKNILGRPLFVYKPLSNFRFIERLR